MRFAPLAVVCSVAAVAAAYPDLSPIRREIRAHMAQFRACYEKGLEKDPKLAGNVVATFTIDKTGAVSDAKATGLPPIEPCIVAVVKTLKFPASAKGEMIINYPFAFAPR